MRKILSFTPLPARYRPSELIFKKSHSRDISFSLVRQLASPYLSGSELIFINSSDKLNSSRKAACSLSGSGVQTAAYPDRIGKRVAPGIYQLVNGKQARLEERYFPQIPDYIVAAVTGGQKHTIFLVAPYDYETLQLQFSHHMREEITIAYILEKKRICVKNGASLAGFL